MVKQIAKHADALAIADAMRVEYEGQAERELGTTKHFALAAKAQAMTEFLTQMDLLIAGKRTGYLLTQTKVGEIEKPL